MLRTLTVKLPNYVGRGRRGLVLSMVGENLNELVRMCSPLDAHALGMLDVI